MKTEALRIGPGLISSVGKTLSESNISGKILYVSDQIVDGIYGSIVRPQIELVGRLKEEFVNYNTIEYAMAILGR